MTNKKIAIIGGGILGLVLAYRLSKEHYEITIYEKNNDWGGLASGLKIDDFYIEKYYHHWFRSDIDIQNLIVELGLHDKLNWHQTSLGIYIDNQLINFSGPIDILKYPKLNFFERLRLGIVSLYLQKKQDYKTFTNITAIDWCNRYYGLKVTSAIWKPLLYGKFGKHFDKISMSWLWARIFDRSSSRAHPFAPEKLGYLDGGFQLLIDTLVQKLLENGVNLVNNVNITKHEYNNQIHQITCELSQSKHINNFDTVVSTLPGPVFTKLFDVSLEEKNNINNVTYLGAICSVMIIDKKFMNYYWLSVSEKDAPCLAVIEHTNLINKQKYNNKHILYIAKYIDTKANLFQKDNKEIEKDFIDYLNKINPEFSEKNIEKIYTFKANYAQHIVNNNYQIQPYTTSIPNLYYANFSQIFPHDRGTNYAVSQANELANLILHSKINK
jgi:protoporphyrinogen oxidase